MNEKIEPSLQRGAIENLHGFPSLEDLADRLEAQARNKNVPATDADLLRGALQQLAFFKLSTPDKIMANAALSALRMMTIPPHKRDHVIINPDGTISTPQI